MPQDLLLQIQPTGRSQLASTLSEPIVGPSLTSLLYRSFAAECLLLSQGTCNYDPGINFDGSYVVYITMYIYDGQVIH